MDEAAREVALSELTARVHMQKGCFMPYDCYRSNSVHLKARFKLPSQQSLGHHLQWFVRK
jgi:hypothetical protein